ncbi:uncharacterized protein LOC105420174 [Amborella trichopoda]|uniref:uncharacterized protein LOC105420174 n=1 Tax=Amborella trichopoda TaxID=13333 RepID=UPI0005D3CC37|nr:uncharacterized protein LOC105420174 [Amborella trichopoda]|eukprot:XP_011621120.1 uncharacterized protein LOC105420174 [Amborella trichopoda]
MITVEAIRIGNGRVSMVSGVYAFDLVSPKSPLWNHMRTMGAAISEHWLLLRDFNTLFNSSEKIGGSSSLPLDSGDFTQVMMDCALSDLGVARGWFSWSNDQINSKCIRRRLDPAMATTNWVLAFLESKVELLPKGNSDHCPLLVTVSDEGPVRPKLFKYFSIREKHSDFMSMISASWEVRVRGTAMYRFMTKLKRLRADPYIWNKEVFGHINESIVGVKHQLSSLHDSLYAEPSNDALMLEEQESTQRLQILLGHEEILWRQKSRQNWLKDGDFNTKFFYLSIVIRRRNDRIISLKDQNGNLLASEAYINRHMISIFENLLAQESDIDPLLANPFLPNHAQ